MSKCIFRRADNDELVELELSLEEISERVVCGRIVLDDGETAYRQVLLELERDRPKVNRIRGGRRRGPMVSRAYEQPLESIGAAVHPSQVEEHRRFLAERGVSGVEVAPNGRIYFRSRGSRRRYLHARGLRDNDGGYGDG